MIYNTYIVYIYSLVFIFIFILINYIYYFATKFSKIITVKNKYTYNNKQSYSRNKGITKFSISDTNDVVYTVDDSLLLFHWTSAEVFNKIDIGKTYKIEGYGKRIPFLGFFPVIISAKLMP